MIAIVGIGNRPKGFSADYLNSIKPLFRLCETLIEAHIDHIKATVAVEKEEVSAVVHCAWACIYICYK